MESAELRQLLDDAHASVRTQGNIYSQEWYEHLKGALIKRLCLNDALDEALFWEHADSLVRNAFDMIASLMWLCGSRNISFTQSESPHYDKELAQQFYAMILEHINQAYEQDKKIGLTEEEV